MMMAPSDNNNSYRVHTRALSRLKLIHEEISAGRHPTVRSLARLLERSERTVKRDLREMRDQHGATLGEALTFQPIPHVLAEPATLQTLARAAAERRTIALDYHSQHRNEQTQREADVLLLHNFAGDWYAIAYDHLRREVRDFHAGRIQRLALTAKYFDPPAGWNADDYIHRGFFMMRGGRITTVAIVFDSYQARWMKERIAFH